MVFDNLKKHMIIFLKMSQKINFINNVDFLCREMKNIKIHLNLIWLFNYLATTAFNSSTYKIRLIIWSHKRLQVI